MGLMDSFKAKLAPAKEKVSGLAQQHGGKIENGLDKAAKMVDEKTKGKYSGKIQTGTGKAKDAMDRLAHKDEPGSPGNSASTGTTGPEGGGTTTPPDAPPPAS
ncbi:antitoxin [Streptomyces sp. MBT65]|uniref:antitoxin n=1 Tax=Streptomyces sp. MBT65 TaxID=1488395 RepID=UPI00190D6FC9|nr:antitoxin [Streptomyces sp. MBT65]MBK3580151.1 antitoxin [Streptomyces sp. MBT65]